MARLELHLPPAVENAHDAKEMVRAWIVDKCLHCSLRVGVFGDKETILWGILLSDVARHIADAREKDLGIPAGESLRQICSSFNFEMNSPTAQTEGNFV